MLITLSLDDHGLLAEIDGEIVRLRSAKACYQFLHEFEDETFIFDSSLNTTKHRKFWVRQCLMSLNVLDGLSFGRANSSVKETSFENNLMTV